jgi:hypothetical protein
MDGHTSHCPNEVLIIARGELDVCDDNQGVCDEKKSTGPPKRGLEGSPLVEARTYAGPTKISLSGCSNLVV